MKVVTNHELKTIPDHIFHCNN